MAFYFYHSLSCIFLLAFAYQQIECHIPPFMPFSVINNISLLDKISKFILVFYKAVSHTNPGAKRNFARSSSYILRHIFLKLSNTSANNNVSL